MMPTITQKLPESLRLVRSVGEQNVDGPLLSIVVCAYQHEQFIEECLGSINDFASNLVELVVIDDGSKDQTLDACTAFAFSPALAARIYTKSNGGLVESLRTGLQLSQGRFVSFMASDDFYNPSGMKQLIARLAQPDAVQVDFLLCQAMYVGGGLNGKDVYGAETRNFFALTPDGQVRRICSEFPSPMLIQSSIFRVSVLRDLKVWDGRVVLDDWPTYIAVFLAAQQQLATVALDLALQISNYRLHDLGVHNRIDRLAKITEEVALKVVPVEFRQLCLANVYVDSGFIHLFRRKLLQGFSYWWRALKLAPHSSGQRIARRSVRWIANRLRIGRR